jgi:REP element-mobilizing transposase RayT
MKSKQFYRRHLPHWQPEGARFFVTFRLKDSIPKVKLWQLKQKYDMLMENVEDATTIYHLHKQYFAEYDQLLDTVISGPTYLAAPKVAELVTQELHHFDTQLYDLIAYCIMSNHVHLLIDTSRQFQDGTITSTYQNLDQIMKRLKGRSAMAINKYLDRPGQFWQRESYDHWVRSERELLNIISYIVENPVKAGLVAHWKDWKYTYWKSS